MKFFVRRASNWRSRNEIEIESLDELLTFIDEKGEGSVIIEAPIPNAMKDHKGTPDVERRNWRMIIYDDFVE